MHFLTVFGGEGVEATESESSGDAEMAPIALRLRTASLLKDRLNGGDASGMEFRKEFLRGV